MPSLQRVVSLISHFVNICPADIFLRQLSLETFFPNRRDDMLMLVSSLIRVGLYSDAFLYLNRCISLCKDI